MTTDGSGVVNLTRNDASDHIGGWSPDGKRIAFTSRHDDNREVL